MFTVLHADWRFMLSFHTHTHSSLRSRCLHQPIHRRHPMTDEEWTAWLKRTKQVKACRRQPRLCVRVEPCGIRMQTLDSDGRIIHEYVGPKGVEIFVLSQRGIELYCVEGGTTYIFRKGALPEPLPNLPPGDAHKAQYVI